MVESTHTLPIANGSLAEVDPDIHALILKEKER